MKALPFCLSLALWSGFAGAEEMRVFHSSDGKALSASFQGCISGKVTLKREDGKVFELPLSRLSADDQAYIKNQASKAGDSAKGLNSAAGHDISNGEPFAARNAEEIAQALQLRPESKSKYGKSWRLYAAFAKDYELFGAMPYSVALYADEDGHATALSIVYANKGDFGSTAGFAQDHFKGSSTAPPKSLEEAMNRDQATITKALTSVLGEGKTERYGEGKTRRTVTRWDWNGHAFLVSNEEGEYVSLAVVPTATADSGGRTAMTRDAEVKARLISSVVTDPNGDVHITQIPMVDQGPKGYCVPATFERVMRTMGLEADMYLLAMVGQSAAGGGTSVERLLDNLRHQVLSKGRRIKEDSIKQLRIRDVSRYIDQGIPVMWRLCSMKAYNEAADTNTAERAKVTDWQEHAAKIATEYADLVKSPKPADNYHLCMIIGYNEATQELAVSDSWGARFELRWVPLAVANWASNGSLVMILP